MPMITMIQPGARVAPFAVTDAALTIGDVAVTFADEQQDTSAEVVIRHSAAGFAVGSDGGAVGDYTAPNRFTGKIENVTLSFP